MPINDSNIFDEKLRFYNRLYRWALLLFVLVITVGVVIAVREVFIVGQRVDQSTDDIKGSMACIVSVFTQPNRQNLTIDDINRCTLVRK